MDKAVALDIVIFDGFDGIGVVVGQLYHVALQQYAIVPFVFCAFDEVVMLY